MTITPGAGLEPSPLLPAWSSNSNLSHNGRWLAYMGSGPGLVSDVWVASFPATATRYQVTSGAAFDPVWSPDDKQLFYIVRRDSSASQLMGIDVQTDPVFKVVGQPFPLPIRGLKGTGPRAYDLSPDGKLFAVVVGDESNPDTAPDQINVTLNWVEELKRRVPVKR